MFNSKKGLMMRHPYAILTIVGLATAGALAIGGKLKCFVNDKMTDMKSMMNNMKRD